MQGADAILLGVVVTLACVFAASMLVGYAADPGQLWRGLSHDRNGHFSYGLDLALALKDFDVQEFVKLIIEARVWPPVHGLVLAAILLLGDLDLRLAIMPSLIGWVCTIVLTFLIARHLFAERMSGNVAGVLAAAFALASPAFRLIGADVMLEGLGAALTAFCLYAYLRARAAEDGGPWWGALALALTVLFFEKSNYWLLTAVSLAIALLSEDIVGRLTWIRALRIRALRTSIKPRDLAYDVARDPLLIAAAALILLIIALYARGPTAVDVFGRRISLYPPENLVTAVWWVLFIRAVLLWRQRRQRFEAAIGLAGRRLFYWHFVPVAISFLIPKRLSAFIWYVGPTNAPSAPFNPLHAVAWQWMGFAEGFHVAPWAAVLVLALTAVAAIRLGRLARGARAVLILVLVSAAGVILHPQQQWRFETTWLFAVWILAGAGGAMVLAFATARLAAVARIVVAAAAVAAIATAQARQGWSDVAYAAAIHPRPGPSDLDLAKAYLPYVRGSRNVGYIITFVSSKFFSWTIREDCRCRVNVDTPWVIPGLSREAYRAIAGDWLRSTRADPIIVIDLQSEETLSGMPYDALAGQIEAIEQDEKFERVAAEPVPALDATVTIWRRRP